MDENNTPVAQDSISETLKTMHGLDANEMSELSRVLTEAKNEGIKPGSLTLSAVKGEGPKSPDEEINDLRTKISKMKLPEKVKLAMFGDGNCRLLLITDPNKMIQACVLKNPQLQDREIEDFTKNPNLTEYCVRIIADNRKWMGSYNVKRNICFNPKTPATISTKWVQHLNKNDVRRLSKSKGIPQALSVVAKKLTQQMLTGK